MSTGLFMQYCVVALAVVISAAVVMHKQFPGITRKLRVVLALPLLAEGRPQWMRRLARRIAPPGAGGGKDCGGCNGCG